MDLLTIREKLQDYLLQELPGFRGPATLVQLTGGQSNPTFKLATEDHTYVVRCKPPGEILESAHAVDREFRYLSALSTTAVPVPRVYLLCEDVEVIGCIFYIMDFVPGTVFRDPALPGLSPECRQEVYGEMARVLAVINEVDVVELGLVKSGTRSENPLLRQIRRWDKQYLAAKTEEIAEMQALATWLYDNLPEEPRGSRLVHGDFRMDNLIFCPERLCIISVLDWELAAAGEPFTDLAYQVMQRYFHRDWPIPGLAGLDVGATGIPSQDEFIRQYLKQGAVQSIDNWPFYLALSFFRFASICQGVKYRAIQGNASGAEAFRVGEMVKPLADMGVRAFQGTL